MQTSNVLRIDEKMRTSAMNMMGHQKTALLRTTKRRVNKNLVIIARTRTQSQAVPARARQS